MAHADNEHWAVRELARVPVVGGVDLRDPRIELGCEGREAWPLERTGGDDHLAGVVGRAIGLDDVAASRQGSQRRDVGVRPDRQGQLPGIGLHVVRHLAPAREPRADLGERHAG